jgi:hypothetical protein
LVAFETCTIAGWVADLRAELGLVFAVAKAMHEAWSGRKVERQGRPPVRWARSQFGFGVVSGRTQ